MQRLAILRNCAKALGLMIVSEATDQGLWVSKVNVHGEKWFDPWENPVWVAQLINRLHLELQWTRKTKAWEVRARVPRTKWTEWHKTLPDAVCTCAANYHTGKFERL